MTLSLMLLLPKISQANSIGIFTTGGGTYNLGDEFKVTVEAKGGLFDSFEGIITVSGPASILAFDAGNATFLPDRSPSNGRKFVGITTKTESLVIASITLKSSSIGSGQVTVSGSRLALAGKEVGTDNGSCGYTIVAGNSITSTNNKTTNIASTSAKVDDSLDKPSGIIISKTQEATVDLNSGTLSGIEFSGNSLPDYTMNLILDPDPILPDGIILAIKTNSQGTFKFILNSPLKAGFYKLSVQGENNGKLTPKSDQLSFEVSLSGGGKVTMLPDSSSYIGSIFSQHSKSIITIISVIIVTIVSAAIIFRKRRHI